MSPSMQQTLEETLSKETQPSALRDHPLQEEDLDPELNSGQQVAPKEENEEPPQTRDSIEIFNNRTIQKIITFK